MLRVRLTATGRPSSADPYPGRDHDCADFADVLLRIEKEFYQAELRRRERDEAEDIDATGHRGCASTCS